MLDDNQLPSADLTGYAVTLAPDAPALYTSNGSLNWMPDASDASSWTNPLAVLLNTYSVQTSNVVSNALLSYQILPGLDIKSNFGYTNLHSGETAIGPLAASPPELRPLISASGTYGNNNASSWIIEPQLDYKARLGRAQLTVLAGSTTNSLPRMCRILRALAMPMIR